MILMQQSSDKNVLDKITYLTGDFNTLGNIEATPARTPFDETVIEFLNDVSRELMRNPRSQEYSDVITFAFWIRRGFVMRMKEEFENQERKNGRIRLGRGVAFHIAPSNVPVNFAYSLAAGLLTGNANIVRIPSRDFAEVEIICLALREVLERYEELKRYCILIRYERDKDINDALSYLCDTRIVWGGDGTIKELRRSQLPPRSTEITFADRFSLAVIDSDAYAETENKSRVAEDFYNDTYFSDQNACTSPRVVVWMGNKKEEAKRIFWKELYELVRKKYVFQDIQGIHKLASAYLAAVRELGVRVGRYGDNRIVRIKVLKLTKELMEWKNNGGCFFEYDCDDVMELRPLCDDKRCQTIGMYGNKEELTPLLLSGIKGVDRVVPMGKTMDFGMVWDGYDLVGQLTRVIVR